MKERDMKLFIKPTRKWNSLGIGICGKNQEKQYCTGK
jgi:hypothetical protein